MNLFLISFHKKIYSHYFNTIFALDIRIYLTFASQGNVLRVFRFQCANFLQL